MVLTFREFRTRGGYEERVLTVLRKHAAAMIHEGQAEAVVVCQRVDIPARVLWIQHQVGPVVRAVDGHETLPLMESALVDSCGVPARLELIDSMYRFPLPPCEVWVVETRDNEVARRLLGVPQVAASDRCIGGISIYRAAEEPSRVIAFLAVASGGEPGKYLRLTNSRHQRNLTLYPVRVRWTIGRLTPGTPSRSSLVRYPRTAFWARLGHIWPSGTSAVAQERIMETRPSQRN